MNDEKDTYVYGPDGAELVTAAEAKRLIAEGARADNPTDGAKIGKESDKSAEGKRADNPKGKK